MLKGKEACEITAQIAKTLHKMQQNSNKRCSKIQTKKSIKHPKKQLVSAEVRVDH